MKGRICICPLASGSSGNAVLVTAGGAKILVDCGLTGKVICQRLEEAGVRPEELDALIVTHEHTDHISGVGIIGRKFGIPVFATIGTWKQMINQIGKIDPDQIRYIASDVPFEIKDAVITPVKTSHDASESIGLVFSNHGKSGGIFTDLGTVDKHIFDMLLDCSVLLIEANHDEKMLAAGAYPRHLKQRITSDIGHLSNRVCGAFCARLAREGKVREITLAHLSKENNTPDLAYAAVSASIEAVGKIIGEDVRLMVADPSFVGEKMVDED